MNSATTITKKQIRNPQTVELAPATADGFARITLKIPDTCAVGSGGMAIIRIKNEDGTYAYRIDESLVLDAWSKAFPHDAVDGVYRTVLAPIKAGQKPEIDTLGDVGAQLHYI